MNKYILMVEKTLDDFFKLYSGNEVLNFVINTVRRDYLSIFAELQMIKREVFSDLEKADLINGNEPKTIKISLPGYDVYLEKLIYSNTPISNAAKIRVNDRKSLNEFRKTIAQVNKNIFKSLSDFGKEIPTSLYFGVLRKAEKVWDKNAINAIRELQGKGIIQIEIWENVDTRNLDIDMLVKDAVKHNKIVQETIDLYIGERYALEYIGGLLKSYIRLKEQLDEKKNEIFSILRGFNLIDPDKSIRVTTNYGTVYIGAYENIRYKKINEEEIKDTLLRYGFREEEFTTIDLTKIMRSEKYALLRKRLEEEKYISPIPEERIYIRDVTRGVFKEAKRKG